jgi:hypothetical protein
VRPKDVEQIVDNLFKIIHDDKVLMTYQTQRSSRVGNFIFHITNKNNESCSKISLTIVTKELYAEVYKEDEVYAEGSDLSSDIS